MSKIVEYLNIINKIESEECMIEMIKKKLEKCNYKLYKYCSVDNEYYFSNLENDIIYYSSINTLNDPFESVVYCSNMNINYSIYKSILNVPEGKQFFDDLKYFIKKEFYDSDVFPNEKIEEIFDDLTGFIFNTFNEIDGINIYTKDARFDELKNKFLIFFSNHPSIKKANISIENINAIFDKFINPDNRSKNNLSDLFNMLPKTDDNIKQLKSFNNKVNQIKNTGPKIIKEILSDNLRITCFSEKPNIILMWSHYSNKHQGFVIEYDLKDIFEDNNKMIQYGEFLLLLFKVEYINSIPELPLSLMDNTANKYNKFTDMLAKVYMKNKCWKYEKEWKSVITSKDNLEFKFIKPSRVIVGVNATKKTIEKLKSICDRRNIKIQKYKLNKKTYSLRLSELDK